MNILTISTTTIKIRMFLYDLGMKNECIFSMEKDFAHLLLTAIYV